MAVTKAQKLVVAYIFNFGKFVTWPQPKLTDDAELNICVYGDESIDLPIDLLNSKTIQAHRIKTYWVARGKPIAHCHILYITESEAPYISRITREIGDNSILTISQIKGHSHSGDVLIELFYEQNKLRFNINLKAAKQKGLTISSRLLKLAKEVID
jgi:hypothetical protein